MTNGVGPSTQRCKAVYRPRIAARLCHGVFDYVTNREYPREYDSWPSLDQANYENGRLAAANMEAAGLQVIAPTSSRTYMKYLMQRQRARQTVGVESTTIMPTPLPPPPRLEDFM
jgi:hypothetical protein